MVQYIQEMRERKTSETAERYKGYEKGILHRIKTAEEVVAAQRLAERLYEKYNAAGITM